MLVKEQFGENFIWGVSTAAYQIEGAHNKDGKGLSIWDTFCQKRNKILGNQNGNTTCDFYHHFNKDIYSIYQLNIKHFRFSISWSRILPEGIGTINYKGIEFYNKVIDFCLELGIEPWVTLYHWDLPQALHNKGGWSNRDIVNWFSEFVAVCVNNFGDRVRNWMILNEPMVFTGAGYFLGIHAPGKKGLNNFLSAAHHATLCQAEGGRIIRSIKSNLKIGTTFSYSHIEPLDPNSKMDIEAATQVDALLNRTFLEPLLGLGYPTDKMKILQRIERFIQPQDDKKMQFDMDFIGLQVYTRELVEHSYFMPFLKAKIKRASDRSVYHTMMNWEVYPKSIYHALHAYNQFDNIPEIIITENGSAFKDPPSLQGRVYDENRKEYLENHIAQMLLAKQEGVPVNGYFVWTLLDNFEWAEGYAPRFGLIHVDFETQKRVIKDSGLWYGEFLANSPKNSHSNL